MSGPLQLEFVLSAPDLGQLPPTRAEIAFIGRSNVGKSSLLNAIAGRKKLALVSNTPGRTQLLNCFALQGTDATVVDCPGYGYANVSKTTRAAWQPMIERYLLEREHLEMVLLLVDGEIGPTKSDLQMLDWLRANALPHSVIATKHDKVKSSQRDKRKRELAASCMLEPGDVIWVSAAKDTGIPRLRDLAALALVGMLLVDGNNVVGSMPDGWWRDRPAAVRRLVDRLRCLVVADGQPLHVVFDVAQPDLPEGDHDGVIVHYATRRGRDAADDRILELLDRGFDQPIEVVTSDHQLAAGARVRGASVLGAGTLLARLDDAGC